MSLQSIARTALATIKTAIPESVVVVTGSDGASCNGVRDTVRYNAGQTDMGEQGVNIETVRIDASELTRPVEGETITIDGESAMVLSVRSDPAGALLAIEYQVTREVA